MENAGKTYIAIDLKSFYASVECMKRQLDPLKTNLVVADTSRTEKTICLAVSPSLKAYGIPGRARLFEVIQKVKEINTIRKRNAPEKSFTGLSYNDDELKKDPSLKLDYIAAPPQMAHYMQCSAQVYKIYLKYIAPEDIHVYSVDEVFIDATAYLKTYNLSARELTMKMILEVLNTLGVTATAGIGTNLYLCKIAMDIWAKHCKPDKNGVRIAELDEMTYRRELWNHRPLTDFWRIGRGYAKKLENNCLYTMGDIARCSIKSENFLYSLFGINAELLIDHAWGFEPCTMAEIKSYKPGSSSICMGQVLQSAYSYEKTRIIVREMSDLLALDLFDKGLVTDKIVLTVGYDVENLQNPLIKSSYKGAVTTDFYGRPTPKSAHGTQNICRKTSSSKLIIDAVTELFERIADKRLTVRRVYLNACNLLDEASAANEKQMEQLDFFTDYNQYEANKESENKELEREKTIQRTVLTIKKRFGKNAVLKGMNLQDGATTISRNGQIGGHKK